MFSSGRVIVTGVRSLSVLRVALENIDTLLGQHHEERERAEALQTRE